MATKWTPSPCLEVLPDPDVLAFYPSERSAVTSEVSLGRISNASPTITRPLASYPSERSAVISVVSLGRISNASPTIP